MRTVSMYKLMLSFIFFSLFTSSVTASNKVNNEYDEVLDSFHQAASEANFDKYMSLLAQDAIYLGTDSGERWNKNEFSAFVMPYFNQGKGWLYVPIERHVTPIQATNIVFFDELLENKNYGRCRGTGLLINTPQGWKILQYNLSIPVPNAIASQVVESIKVYRATDK